jgi:glutathione peroxidase
VPGRCRAKFPRQYDGLQALYDEYRDRGLVVLAIPSDDFNQELASAEKGKEFCMLNLALDFPVADPEHVKGEDAHPFYKAVELETGFVPR